MILDKIKKSIYESARLKQAMAETLAAPISQLAQSMISTLKNEGKILLMGNGGSASDAQHIAAELVGRCLKDRRGLPAIALNTDGSILTALSNDFGYDVVFQRQVEALAKPQDLVLGISTSGRSKNVYQALEFAQKLGITTAALLGGDGGRIRSVADLCLIVPSYETPRIQEGHILIGHIVCELVEDAMPSIQDRN